MKLVALEERVLYSAGPIPAEIVDADLVSDGDLQGIDATDLGLNSVEMAATDTLEFLQQQIDAANALDSIEDIQPMEMMPSDLDEGDPLDVEISAVQSDDLLDQVVEADAIAVSSDVQSSERITAATSAGFPSGVTLSGRIVNDVDGDGNIEGDGGLGGVEVLLYRDFFDDQEPTQVSSPFTTQGSLDQLDADFFGAISTTTDANGNYEFTEVGVGETFFIVVNSTTLANDVVGNSVDSANKIFGEQTYAAEGALFDRGQGEEVSDGGTLYGGYDVNRSDGGHDVGQDGDVASFEHIIRRTVTGEDQSDVDFGFSFNVVTNTLGGNSQDGDQNSLRGVQGSFRQFIQNANEIEGNNALRFVPVAGSTYTSDVTGDDIYFIDITDALPTITDAGTTINGLAYHADGTEIVTSPANVSPNGSVNGVGVDDSLLGPDFNPSLTLSGLSTNGLSGLNVVAADFEVSNLAIVNFQTGVSISGEGASSASIHDNFIGVHADASSASRAQLLGVSVTNADDVEILDNFIVDSVISGINIVGTLNVDDAARARIENNYIVNQNFVGQLFSDGISLLSGTDGAEIVNNRIENSVEFGIDLYNNRGSVTIERNTIANAGGVRESDQVLTGGAIGLTNPGNIVQHNEIVNNNAAGILVRGDALNVPNANFPGATGNLISQNYFENNEALDIDLTRPLDNAFPDGGLDVAAGDGVDSAEGFDAETGNNGIDQPVLDSVSLIGNVLTIEGSYSTGIADAKIELYLLGENDSRRYFATINDANQTSFDSATGNFTAELTLLPADFPPGFMIDSDVAAIVIDGSTNDTSEFGEATTVARGRGRTVFDTDDNTFVINENTRSVFDFEATAPGGRAVNYSIVGGDDASLFDITRGTGQLTFNSPAPDFETPDNSENSPENTYTLTIRVDPRNGNGEGTQRDITVVVADVPEAFDTEQFSQIENDSVVHQVTVDGDGSNAFRYEFDFGGNDAAFEFDENTGEFSFVESPDFEDPLDGNRDNVYSFTVAAISTADLTPLTTDPEDSAPSQTRIERDFTLTVTNEPEAFDQLRFTQNENEIVEHQLSVDGDDSNSFRYEFDFGDNEADFDFDESTGEFSFVAGPDFETPTDGNEDSIYTFTVTAVSIANPDSRLQTEINLAVANVPEAFDQVAFTQNENEIVDYQLSADGDDNSSFRYEFDFGGNEADFDFDESTGEFSFVTAPDFEAPTDGNEDNIYTFTVTAVSLTDPDSRLQTEINLAVANVPEAFDQVVFSQNENEIVDHQLSVDGANSNSFRYEFDFGDNEADFDFDESTGEFSFVAAPDFEAAADTNEDNIYTFTVTAVSLADPDSRLQTEINLAVTNVPEAFDQVIFTQNENEIVDHQLSVDGADSNVIQIRV